MSATPSPPATPFNVVYHVATLNHWRDIVAEQFPLLLSNQNVSDILISIASDSDSEESALVEILRRLCIQSQKPYGFKWYREPLDTFEHRAMQLVDNVALSSEHPILYFHAKGVSYFPPLRSVEEFRRHTNQLVRQADHWADFLVHSPYDACGTLLVHDSQHAARYFGGNCWMAKPLYIRSLIPYIQYADQPHHGRQPWDRFLAEMAVNRMDRMNPFAIDGSNIPAENFNQHMAALRGSDQTIKRDPGGHFTPATLINAPENSAPPPPSSEPPPVSPHP